MEPVNFPYMIVRYQKDDLRLPAVVVFYAVSMQQASALFKALIKSEQLYDPMAHYAIRVSTDLAYASLYRCGCTQLGRC